MLCLVLLLKILMKQKKTPNMLTLDARLHLRNCTVVWFAICTALIVLLAMLHKAESQSIRLFERSLQCKNEACMVIFYFAVIDDDLSRIIVQSNVCLSGRHLSEYVG